MTSPWAYPQTPVAQPRPSRDNFRIFTYVSDQYGNAIETFNRQNEAGWGGLWDIVSVMMVRDDKTMEPVRIDVLARRR